MGLMKRFGLWLFGFKKIMCPYGILLAVKNNYPDDGIKYAANLVGQLLDPEGNGEVTHTFLK